MSRRSVLALVVAAAAVLAAGLVLTVAASGSLHGPGVIRVSALRIDTARPDGDRVGGLTISQELLYASGYSKSIGSAVTVCQYIGKGKTLGLGLSLCFGTYRFKRGDIEARGIVTDPDQFILSVIGGTGYYTAAGGTLLNKAVHGKPLRSTLLFQLLSP